MQKDIYFSWKIVSFATNCAIRSFTYVRHLSSLLKPNKKIDSGFMVEILFNSELRWVMVMFAFRMVMVARVGDQVYSDEQEYFYCNTNTSNPPSCYLESIRKYSKWAITEIRLCEPFY